MMADGLTKLASAEVLKLLRDCMNGSMPAIPGEEFEIKGTDDCWWALMVIRKSQGRNPQEGSKCGTERR